MSQLPAQRLPGPFGPVKDLLPKEQVVERIRHDEAIGSAVERMADHEYSQLPVERDGHVIGLFSWRSFGKMASSALPAVATKDLRVESCLAAAPFISPDSFIDTGIDWTEVECVLVGSPSELIGLLAIYDVVGRLQDFGEAFFLIHEIEHLLRTMIAEAVGDTRLEAILASMTLPPRFPRPQALTDLTFSMYGGLVCSKSRWTEFAPMFFGERAAMKDAIDEVADLRNTVFHFKRPVTVSDVDTLRRFRDKLCLQREAYGRRFPSAQ